MQAPPMNVAWAMAESEEEEEEGEDDVADILSLTPRGSVNYGKAREEQREQQKKQNHWIQAPQLSIASFAGSFSEEEEGEVDDVADILSLTPKGGNGYGRAREEERETQKAQRRQQMQAPPLSVALAESESEEENEGIEEGRRDLAHILSLAPPAGCKGRGMHSAQSTVQNTVQNTVQSTVQSTVAALEAKVKQLQSELSAVAALLAEERQKSAGLEATVVQLQGHAK